MKTILILKNKPAAILLTVTVFLMAFASCKKTLELEPADSITSEEALSTSDGVKQTLIGAYDECSLEDMYGGNIMRNAELFGGTSELNWLGTYTGPREIFNHDMLVTNDDATAFWEDSYNAINICNNVLSALAVVDEEDRSRVEGEAKFLRAYVLFDLTRFFGQQYEAGGTNGQLGVPVVLTPGLSSTDNALVARNTVAECYAQVIADLTDAAALLPEDNDVFASSPAASAMLARVYLQQGDYANARDEADQVISSGDYSLVSDYAGEFGQDDNTSEDIFSIQVSDLDGINALNEFFSTSNYGGRGDIQVLDTFVDAYADSDLRKDLYYKVANKWRTGKYNNRYANVTLIRLAEMYLTRCECNVRLGTSVGAAPVDDYNKTHVRAGLPPAASITLDDVLTERHFELAHEGFLVHDLKRTHQNIGTLTYNDVLMVFPIPLREIELDPNLVQNPGY